MEGRLKPIGGEFWFNESILNSKANNFGVEDSLLLNGGQSAIGYILQDIKLKNNEYILMPSYLCPTILYKFIEKNIKVVFYEIKEDLSINIENIKKLIKIYNVKAIFFIDYFGFYHDEENLIYLRTLKDKGVILIEDAVQMLWFKRLNKFIGNYIFNSYRKFLPADGSLILCNKDYNFGVIEDNYSKLISEARIAKTQYIKNNIGKEEEFLNKFNEAEKSYYRRKTINGIEDNSKKYLKKVNYQLIKERRLNNYNYLYEKLKELNIAKLMYDNEKIEDNVPLVLPVLIKYRDFVRKELRKYNIYCPVHWDITREKWAVNFEDSLSVSRSILSIPIDWRYDRRNMDYFLDRFSNILIKLNKTREF